MLKPMLAALAATSFLAIAACTQEVRVEEEPTVGESLEQAGEQIEDAAQDAGNEIEQAGDNAAEAVEDATDGNPNTNP